MRRFAVTIQGIPPELGDSTKVVDYHGPDDVNPDDVAVSVEQLFRWEALTYRGVEVGPLAVSISEYA